MFEFITFFKIKLFDVLELNINQLKSKWDKKFSLFP